MSDFFRPLRRQNNPSKLFRARTTCAIGFFIFCGVLPFSTLAATSQEKSALPIEETSTKTFEYQLENRPDPFVPFITEKAASSNINMDEIVVSGEPLTGMQIFEPGQLTVVALVKTGAEHLAMVQDTTGKGYTLLKGTKVGRYGVVKNFTPQSVIIEETTVTRAGKQSVTEVVMLLKKEGEK